jgi:uncharacterized protein YqkB
MRITITETATNKLQEKISNKSGYLKLKYDIEDCGCAVNGVAALWLERERQESEGEIVTGSIPIYLEHSKEVYFAEKMTIDYSETSGCFQLKSPNEYLNPRMSFFDKSGIE